MTAAYRLKGIGWFGGAVVVVLGFYLVSLQVATERKKLEQLNGRILSAQRDIRALETEFDTRANLAQLEKWNGDTLALSAPVARQFVSDEGALAALDVTQPMMPAMKDGRMQTAALLVPSGVQQPLNQPQPVQVTQPQAAMTLVAANAPALRTPAAVRVAAVVATPQAAPARAVEASVVRAAAAVAKVRPQAVAMLDRKLLSDSTFSDILSSARAEARKR
ncbi:hypothetical protein KCP91_04395 [Microvirga sp. SRT01]|uniref:Colicin transporter n=1 Tax=Sphingomonas longa TaxID=2778730 RepID=A0ABS2D3W5_9SPHN|nr:MULTISPECIES: hypothetical protein [Alphaproteobacteria]MBM6575599.1 hypothetical protein [Sphingomonas sp. BT552]MBR7708647.1 hypothetical protein [Microvirga sp. SRT01]